MCHLHQRSPLSTQNDRFFKWEEGRASESTREGEEEAGTLCVVGCVVKNSLDRERDDHEPREALAETVEERSDAVSRFSSDARFFVATPQAGGFGLNLQFCTLQYWYSRTQRMDVNKQAEERSHRIGTKQPVIYKDFIMQGTVDEDIVQRDRDRRTLLDGLQTKDLKKITDVLGIKSIAHYEYA